MSKRSDYCKKQNISKYGLKADATAWAKRYHNRILRRAQDDQLRRDQYELEISEHDPDCTSINRGARWKR